VPRPVKELDQLLDDDELYQRVREDFGKRHRNILANGQHSTPAEVLLRLLILKHFYQWSYQEDPTGHERHFLFCRAANDLPIPIQGKCLLREALPRAYRPDTYTQVFKQREECGGKGEPSPSQNRGENGSPFPDLPIESGVLTAEYAEKLLNLSGAPS
jgi:hypothetical protein